MPHLKHKLSVRRQPRQIDRRVLERAALVETCEQQQVVDEDPHARRLFFDATHRLREVVGSLRRAAPEEFGVTAYRCEGGAQLVRRVTHEAPQSRL